ncbi:MAG: MATE family efflux transporter [Alphaproteobacteria bacterium]|nr:MATE family efflux transporter [Alphaproteobacteria bacterium]
MLSANTHRFTDGNIVKSLIRFALPFLGSNFLVALYGAADVLIVSRFSDSATLAATATGAQAVFTLMALAIGLALGGTVLIGQYFGAKKDNDVSETITTLFCLFGIVSIMCSGIFLILTEPITNWLKAPPESWHGTYQYILICGGGIFFTFAYEAISAVLRGVGDSKNPLKFVAIACICNIILDFVFIGYFHWGAAGAASATVISQGISAFIGGLYIKKQHIISFQTGRYFIPEKAKMILKLGIPTAIQQTIVFASFTIMTIAVNKLGVIETAALGITNRIDGFLILPALAFGAAVSVMTAQNMGANKFKRAQQSFYIGFLMSLIFAIPAFYLMSVKPINLMQLVTNDPVLIQNGSYFMLAYSPDCLLLALVFCLNGFFNGCGRTTFTMIINGMSALVFRIPLIFIARDLFEVGLSMPFSTIPQLLAGIIYFLSNHWKKILILDKGK